MKAIILARVSTEEQKEAGNSSTAQVDRMELYCKRNNLEIVKKFDFYESAYKTQRDEFDNALAFLENQKDFYFSVTSTLDLVDERPSKPILRTFLKETMPV